MTKMKTAFLAAAVALMGSTVGAQAYTITTYEGAMNGSGFNTTNVNPFGAGAPGASFTYNGPLNFSLIEGQNTTPNGDLNSGFFTAADISGYAPIQTPGSASQVVLHGIQVADFSTLSSFLGSSASGGFYAWASWYSIDLGTLAAGTDLTITHDDGISLYENGSQIGSTVSQATSAVTDNVTVAATGDIKLYYSRQNGSPSILEVAVPEPVSMSLFGAGLIGMGLIRRRRAAKVG
jgi:hypothetical protein